MAEPKKAFVTFPIKKFPVKLRDAVRSLAEAEGISIREEILRLLKKEVRNAQ